MTISRAGPRSFKSHVFNAWRAIYCRALLCIGIILIIVSIICITAWAVAPSFFLSVASVLVNISEEYQTFYLTGTLCAGVWLGVILVIIGFRTWPETESMFKHLFQKINLTGLWKGIWILRTELLVLILFWLVLSSDQSTEVIRIMAAPEGSNWLLRVIVSFAWWLWLCLILGIVVRRSSIILILQANEDIKDDAREVDLNWPVALMRQAPVLVAASAIFDAADRLGKPEGHLATLNFNLICAGPVLIAVAVKSFFREVKNFGKKEESTDPEEVVTTSWRWLWASCVWAIVVVVISAISVFLTLQLPSVLEFGRELLAPAPVLITAWQSYSSF